MPSDGDDPVWEGPASSPFEAPQSTRLVPVGPAAAPTTRRTDASDSADDQEEPRPDDADDAQAPVFAPDTMRALGPPRPDERASFVSHGGGRPRFASPDRQPPLRPPATVADKRLGPTPPTGLFAPPAAARAPDAAGREEPAAANAEQVAAANVAPPWVSTSPARRAAAADSPGGQQAQAEVVVRIELVIIDHTGAATPNPEVSAPEVPASTRAAGLPAGMRAVVRLVGVLALVGIGLFLVQLGVWLAR